MDSLMCPLLILWWSLMMYHSFVKKFQKVYLNGEFLDREEAKISPDDRGFLLGDGVYDTLRTYNGELFRFEQHAKRLFQGLDEMKIELSLSQDELKNRCVELLRLNEITEAVLRITVSRGVSKGGYQVDPSLPPTIYISLRETPDIDAILEKGIDLALSKIPRPLPFHTVQKTISIAAMALAKMESADFDVVMLDQEGNVAEGAASALLLIKDDRFFAPPKKNVLPSITRQVIEEIYPVTEKVLSVEDFRTADEVVLAVTTLGPVPVTKFDDVVYSKSHQLISDLMKRYEDLVDKETRHV
ncbi:MAG: aminotransferase class IV family protein [Candidatus Lindowbacteria bacterium]|nr:aminotransferase class IV family protein [Candidatus Lindowbacteria bacterium]